MTKSEKLTILVSSTVYGIEELLDRVYAGRTGRLLSDEELRGLLARVRSLALESTSTAAGSAVRGGKKEEYGEE